MTARCMVLLALASVSACVRVYNDDGSKDAGHDAPAIEVGVCDAKYGGYAFAQSIGSKLVDGLLADCRLKNHFAALPANRLPHLRECFALQIGSILQCTRDGARVKYPGFDSAGVLCRDMKSSHLGNGLTQADFAAFLAVVDTVLDSASVGEDDAKTVLATFGNPTTKKDIVESSANTLSKASDGCDAGVLLPDAASDGSIDADASADAYNPGY